MKNKKIVIFLIMICFILIIYGSWKIYCLSKSREDLFDYGVIYSSSKSDIQSFLYADEEKIYYLDGYNPKDVFIVSSSINDVDENALILAQENIRDGKMSFNYNEENRIYIQNILPAIYNWTPTIDELKKQVDIIEKEYNYNEYSFVNIVCSENNVKKLYYTDKFGRNIYTDGVEQIYVEYNDKNFELQTILTANNSISDNVYLTFRKDPRTIITYLNNDDDSIIEGLTQEGNNMYLEQKFSNNEVYYIFKCV